MILLDLFSGIGGFAEGFNRAGYNITTHYFSEIDKHCIANYKYNFKNSEYVGSVTSLDGGSIKRPNIITFGSPCQDFSMAGKRAGMEGQRSSLIREAIRLITECKPDVFIWENVKGVFSSNYGADFWGVVQAFSNIGNYRLEWQLLNTAWVLPQNRERVYLIGHLGEGGGRNIFPIGSDDYQINDLCGQQGIANTLTARYYGSQATGSYVVKREFDAQNVIAVGDYRSDEGIRIREDNNSPTLQARARTDLYGQPIVIQMNPNLESGGKQPYQQNRIYNESGIIPSLMKDKADLIIANAVTPDAYLARGERKRDENGKAVLTSMCDRRIRRLTEIECERLQGFKDNWTMFGNYDGEIKRIAKTQRYKMCGNAVTVDIVELIANRLDFRI